MILWGEEMGESYFIYSGSFILIFIAGACIGRILKVLMYYMSQETNLTEGRDHCPVCHTGLTADDLLPFVRYVFLKGRCRCCDASIFKGYLLVELAIGVAAVFSIMIFGFTGKAVIVFLATCILTAIAFIDLDTMIIPDRFNIAMFILAVISVFVFSDIRIVSRILGILVISAPMLIVNLFVKDSFGGGDIKLCAACGFLLGWQQMLAAGLLAMLLGGLYGAVLILMRKKDRKDHFAFGPFLSLGIIMILFAGMGDSGGYVDIFGL